MQNSNYYEPPMFRSQRLQDYSLRRNQYQQLESSRNADSNDILVPVYQEQLLDCRNQVQNQTHIINQLQSIIQQQQAQINDFRRQVFDLTVTTRDLSSDKQILEDKLKTFSKEFQIVTKYDDNEFVQHNTINSLRQQVIEQENQQHIATETNLQLKNQNIDLAKRCEKFLIYSQQLQLEVKNLQLLNHQLGSPNQDLNLMISKKDDLITRLQTELASSNLVIVQQQLEIKQLKVEAEHRLLSNSLDYQLRQYQTQQIQAKNSELDAEQERRLIQEAFASKQQFSQAKQGILNNQIVLQSTINQTQQKPQPAQQNLNSEKQLDQSSSDIFADPKIMETDHLATSVVRQSAVEPKKEDPKDDQKAKLVNSTESRQTPQQQDEKKEKPKETKESEKRNVEISESMSEASDVKKKRKTWFGKK